MWFCWLWICAESPVCLQASKQAEITKLQEEITKVNVIIHEAGHHWFIDLLNHWNLNEHNLKSSINLKTQFNKFILWANICYWPEFINKVCFILQLSEKLKKKQERWDAVIISMFTFKSNTTVATIYYHHTCFYSENWKYYSQYCHKRLKSQVSFLTNYIRGHIHWSPH